jgi:hypothetical protein
MYQPDSSDTYSSRAVLNSFRTAIAKRLSDALPLTLEQAFAGVGYGKKRRGFHCRVASIPTIWEGSGFGGEGHRKREPSAFQPQLPF